MSHSLRLLGICGSLRQQSYNRSLFRIAEATLPPMVTMQVGDLAPIPLYNGDLETPGEPKGLPKPVQELRELIRQADALVIATPEYNHSIPGVLKNAIDWVSRPPDQPLSGKSVALLGGGGGFGTWGSQSHLRHVLAALNAYVLNKPSVTIANVWEKITHDGLCDDSQLKESIARLLEALVTWTRQLRLPSD